MKLIATDFNSPARVEYVQGVSSLDLRLTAIAVIIPQSATKKVITGIRASAAFVGSGLAVVANTAIVGRITLLAGNINLGGYIATPTVTGGGMPIIRTNDDIGFIEDRFNQAENRFDMFIGNQSQGEVVARSAVFNWNWEFADPIIIGSGQAVNLLMTTFRENNGLSAGSSIPSNRTLVLNGYQVSENESKLTLR